MLLRPQCMKLRLSNTLRILQTIRVVPPKRIAFPLRRHGSSSTTPTTPPRLTGKKPLFPERLLIYHAGTARTVFLGCLKVTTIFIFSFFALVVAPSHFFAEDKPKWISIAVMLSGTVPLVAVFYITSPFVNYIHLRLPTFARHSKELLVRYSKSLPPNAELDITTMNIIGKPRVIRMKITELKSKKERFGLVNFVRDEGKETLGKKTRPWWMGKKARAFGVHGGRTKILKGEIWENVRRSIEKRSAE